MGVDRVLTLDLHSGQIQGYFHGRAPLDNLQMAFEFAQYIRTCRWFASDTTVIVAPDAGGVGRAHAFADILGVSHIVTVMKRRAKAGVVESMQTVGDVKGYSCIIIDDMCDTGGTLVAACSLLRDMGAARVVACITHGILSGPCCERVNSCAALEELIVSDSLPQDEHVHQCPKLKVLSIASLLAQAIETYNTESSISELFTRPATPSPRFLKGSRRISPISALATPFPEAFPSDVLTIPRNRYSDPAIDTPTNRAPSL
jgi:ribose-phosphate pyrophosphokinase